METISDVECRKRCVEISILVNSQIRWATSGRLNCASLTRILIFAAAAAVYGKGELLRISIMAASVSIGSPSLNGSFTVSGSFTRN